MSETATLPTRKSEDFRYADMAALKTVWPIAARGDASCRW